LLCRELCSLGRFDRAALFLWPTHPGAVCLAGSHGLDDASLERLLADHDVRPQEIATLLANDGAADQKVARLRLVQLGDGTEPIGFVLAQTIDERPKDDHPWEAIEAFARCAAIALRESVPSSITPTRAAASERTALLALARHLHDTVAQRLTGLALLLENGQESIADSMLARGRDEIAAAIADLRDVVSEATQASTSEPSTPTDELALLRDTHPGVQVCWSRDGVPSDALALDGLAAIVATEALRNVRKHAHPSQVDIAVVEHDEAATITIRNDGVGGAARGTGLGLGLRLMCIEACERGGLVSSGEEEDGTWCMTLIEPRTA
jgi:hypothetical protein